MPRLQALCKAQHKQINIEIQKAGVVGENSARLHRGGQFLQRPALQGAQKRSAHMDVPFHFFNGQAQHLAS